MLSTAARAAARRRSALLRRQQQLPLQKNVRCSIERPPVALPRPFVRSFASSSDAQPAKEEEEEAPTEKNGEESFRDTVHRLKGDDTTDTSKNKNNNPASDEFLRQTATWWTSFREQVGQTWQELVRAGERKSINKKIITHPHATPEGDEPYTGPVDIMVIDPAENLTAWERMQKRLTKAPIIQDILSRTEQVYQTSGAKDAKRKLDHLAEDAREAWETSQNPWVYRASSVYDTLTAETPESVAVRDLRELDPEFTLEDWRRDVVEHTLPQIMEWFLEGKINQLKPWLAEGVFKRLAAEMKAREQEGVQIDTHVLGIMNSEILACEVGSWKRMDCPFCAAPLTVNCAFLLLLFYNDLQPDEVEKGSPIIVLHFMCQQINCVRKKKGGEVVEGAEDDIRANSYVAAFQREYNAEAGRAQLENCRLSLQWRDCLSIN